MGILDKIQYIVDIAKRGTATKDEIDSLEQYSLENSDNLVLGRFFGYSVAEMAIACYKVIHEDKLFDKWFNTLDRFSQDNVTTFLKKRLYLQM